MSQSVVVKVSHRYTAPAEKVFDAWLTPSSAARFLFATRTGNIMRCEMQPRVGGAFTVVDRRPNADGDESVFDAVHRGEFVEIVRPRRLVFDFCLLNMPESTTRVTVELQPLGAMACELTLSHDLGDHPEAALYADASRRGWTTMLALLEREIFPKRVGIQL